MKLKDNLKWLPKTLIAMIIVAMVVASFDGVALSMIVSNVTKFNQHSTNKEVFIYISLSILGMFLVYLAMVLKEYLKNRALKIMNIHLKRDYIYEQVQISNVKDDASSKVSKIFNDFKLVETDYFTLIFELIGSLLTSVVSAVYILILNVPIGLLFILFSMLPMITPKVFGAKLTATAQIWQNDSGRFLSKVTDLFRGINSIRTYRAQKEMYDDTISYLNTEEIAYEKMNNSQVEAMFLTIMLSMISFLLPLGAGLFFVANGYISAAVVIGIFLASDRVVGPLRSSSQYLNQMKTTENIRKDLREQVIQFKDEAPLDPNAEPELDLVNVSFSYGPNKQILKDVTLKIPFGSKLLISGSSGKGKTTLLNLIQGFLTPTVGDIEIAKKLVSSDGSNALAYIRQEPYLFDDTIRFNLTLGKTFTDEECLAILQRVGLVAELGPDLLDQTYGENGNSISGGQRQRIEIARALLFNKKIILLDEATSSLDENLTHQIRKIIWSLPCTVIEVAHQYDQQELQDNQVLHYQLDGGTMKLV